MGTILDIKCVAGDIPFTNLKNLTNGTIVAGKPDLYYGSRPEQLDVRVRREQSRMIIPSSQGDLPILPNFTLETKGPDGTLSVAARQPCYNGALGARGMQSLQSYGRPGLEYDNKAYTISTIYQGGQLKMFACHPIPPRSPGEEPGFLTPQIETWGLTGNADKFRQGASAFRNARDWAQGKRDAAIKQANELAKGPSVRVSSLQNISVEGQKRLMDWDQASPRQPQLKTAWPMIEKRCRDQPHKLAIDSWDGRVTYGDLEQRASAMAEQLLQLGLKPGTFIGLLSEKSMMATVVLSAF